MSEENVEIVRRAAEEFNRGGMDAVIDTYWAPEIVWDMTNADIPGFGVYSGYDEVRGLVRRLVLRFQIRRVGVGGRGDIRPR